MKANDDFKLGLPGRRASVAAFGLAELLVSALIIGLLVILSLPVVNRMRAQSLSVKCVSNLREVGSALAAFAGENNQRLPARFMESGGNPRPRTNAEKYWNSRLLLGGYLPDSSVLYCPACFPFSPDRATRDISDSGGQTYGMRVFSTPGMGWEMRKLRDMPLAGIENRSDFFLVTDSIWMNYTESNGQLTQGYSVYPGSNGLNQRIHLRHAGKANVLFADFHVEAKPASYFLEEVVERQGEYSNRQRFYVHP